MEGLFILAGVASLILLGVLAQFLGTDSRDWLGDDRGPTSYRGTR
jgi:hypothetical protein